MPDQCKDQPTSVKINQPVDFSMCKQFTEDQNVEMGEYITWNGTNVLRPFGKDVFYSEIDILE